VTDFDEFLETLKRVAAVLREADVPFLLGGGLAVWARGGPETAHDLDFMVRPEDADRAVEALQRAGLRTASPPEDWLYKAWDGDTLVDVIFRPSGGEVDDAMFDRAEVLDVQAVRMDVMSLEDVLEIARALREQVDWEAVQERTCDSPYARAFFYLAAELEIVEPSQTFTTS
jgi:putative nucleotidyltransferase-like protein